ncbi:hypothetical protein XCR1_3070002 [Xenorhabdus cabanillasii JM26]|uniref:Uncharacterized protein n=1 Tax=Xenorhabdus cabanillasii JM26 TaxID=1427517 RepID=W1J906_9GAMM|nr:hypothetical protein XCR1_3070002 [Xenorhabdus cabanillasii JM26]
MTKPHKKEQYEIIPHVIIVYLYITYCNYVTLTTTNRLFLSR